MFFAFAHKGSSLCARFSGLGEVVETSHGTVLEGARVFWKNKIKFIRRS